MPAMYMAIFDHSHNQNTWTNWTNLYLYQTYIKPLSYVALNGWWIGVHVDNCFKVTTVL